MGAGPTRRGVLAGAAALAWVSDAFAAGPSERQVELFSRWHAARRRGVPLLALVIPENDRWNRGAVLGAVLNEADGPLLAALAGHEPVCATPSDLRLLGVDLGDDTWFARVGTDRVPAVVEVGGPKLRTSEWGTTIDEAAAALAVLLPPVETTESLVEEGRRRWVTEPLPGSRWANEGGCGFHIEGEESAIVFGCGMGSVPERGGRFLLFADEVPR